MITTRRHRYPGAQPFGNDEVSRRTFFGRNSASVALADQILANRVVVVFARSGLGKTSLLNAGVAPRLREEKAVPIFLRIGAENGTTLPAIRAAIEAGAAAQNVEFVPGESDSLWNLMRTAELWCNDVLQMPVLIFDQFEELFTLTGAEEREAFLSELSFLLRDVPPRNFNPPATGRIPSSAPLHVVFSLREDFLGFLEEASDHIPQILDSRYRVAPLTLDSAREAITGPAELEDPTLSTGSFRVEDEAVQGILDYLARSHSPTRSSVNRGVIEPFHLQLICQQLEAVAAGKQAATAGPVVLSMTDIGGEAALGTALRTFYADSIRAVPRRYRGMVRRMCELYLISSEGRRLSIEERELHRNLELTPTILQQLVERRLLRTDRRSESTYYELSHDTLVAVVLKGRKTPAMLIGGVGVAVGWLTHAAGWGLLWTFAAAALNAEPARRANATFATLLLSAIMYPPLAYLGSKWLENGLRRGDRYRRNFDLDNQPLPPPASMARRFFGHIPFGTGQCLLIISAAIAVVLIPSYVVGFVLRNHDPKALGKVLAGFRDLGLTLFKGNHVVRDSMWLVAEVALLGAAGFLSHRWGAHLMWPQRFRSAVRRPGVNSSQLTFSSLEVLAGVFFLFASVLCLETLFGCATHRDGMGPGWLSLSFVPTNLSQACHSASSRAWDGNLFWVLVPSLCAFLVALHLLWRGARGIVAWHHPLGRPIVSNKALAAILAAITFVMLGIPRILPPLHRFVEKPEPPPLSPPADRSELTYPGWAVGRDVVLESTSTVNWISATNTPGQALGVTTPASDLVWIAGGTGLLRGSADGGKTWTDQPKQTKSDLNSIDSIGLRHLIAVGDQGVILYSVTAGRSWSVAPHVTDENLKVVSFGSPSTAWAVGFKGVILRTTDGGSSWAPQKSTVSQTLNSVVAASDREVWAVGDDGLVLHSTDAGETWQQRRLGKGKALYGVGAADLDHVTVAGEGGQIFVTEDRGSTWTTVQSPTSENISDVRFADAKFGWAVGRAGVVLRSSDGGHTWTGGSSSTHKNLITIAFPRNYSLLGVTMGGNPGRAKLGSSQKTGVNVVGLSDNGIAGPAGMKVKDVILAIDHTPIASNEDMRDTVSVLPPGTCVPVEVAREGKMLTLQLRTYPKLGPSDKALCPQ